MDRGAWLVCQILCPWGCRESDATEGVTLSLFFSFIPHLDQYDRIESLRDLSLSTYIY